MKSDDKPQPASELSVENAVGVAVRLGLLIILVYASWRIIAPFLTIILWSAILAVALYPGYSRLSKWLGARRRLAAALITILCLVTVLGPVAWLGFALLRGAGALAAALHSGEILIPPPHESLKSWPLVGNRIYEVWQNIATNLQHELVRLAPTLKPLAKVLLETSKNVTFGLLEFLASLIISGFMFAPGPRLVSMLSTFLDHVLLARGKEMVALAGLTIRNVARGVVGIALLQSLFAGAGFAVAGIPAAGLWTFLSLVLGILQIGPGIIIFPMILWSWTWMEPTHALMFTVYMTPVGLIDNVLKPIVMASGLSIPMPVIFVGVIGGTIAYGIVGLFLGPIILSVSWALLTAWFSDDDHDGGSSSNS